MEPLGLRRLLWPWLAWAFLALIAMGPVLAADPSGPGRQGPAEPGQVGSDAKPADGQSFPLPTVSDVALRPDGTLEGRVVGGAKDARRGTLAGLPVILLRQTKPVAETVTDAHGRFVVHHLPGGTYQVVLGTSQGCWSRYCRVWPSVAAPPRALEQVDFSTEGGIVRGQSPFPSATFRQVATIAGIAAGAIAVPVIYTTKQEPWIPASP